MKKHIIIQDDFIDILRDGYNIIEHTVYDEAIIEKAKELLALMEEQYNV